MTCYGNIIYGPSVDVIVANGLPNLTTNVVLPTTGKPKLNITPTYADDGVTIMYYEYELTIDTLLYSVNSVTGDTETEVARIKKILGTPGLKLKFSPCGLGITPTVNGTVGVSGTDYTPDLKGGPYPQEVGIEPDVTNEAIVIHWKVTTRITHCSSYISLDLIQYNSELDVDTDTDGNVNFTLFVTYQRSTPIPSIAALTPLVNTLRANAGTSFQGMTRTKRTSLSRDQRIAYIRIVFKEIHSDNAFFPYTQNIEATDEIHSSLLGGRYDGAGFATWARNISATITLPKRINKVWAWIIFRKILAERLRNLQQLTTDNAALFLEQPANQKTDAEIAKTQKNWYLLLSMKIVNPLYTRTMKFEFSYLICTDLRTLISRTLIAARVNSMKTRGGPYDAAKALMVTANASAAAVRTLEAAGADKAAIEAAKLTAALDLKAAHTAMANVDAGTLSSQWLAWDQTQTVFLNGQQAYESSGPITVQQCTHRVDNLPAKTTFAATYMLDKEFDDDDSPMNESSSAVQKSSDDISPGSVSMYEETGVYAGDKYLDPTYTWLDYKNKFIIEERANNVQARYLQAVDSNYYMNNDPNGPTRSETRYRINNLADNPDSGGLTYPRTINRGSSSYQIRMRGYAVRVGYPIECPIVDSVNGVAVTRTGLARFTCDPVVTGQNPVYLAMWDVLYNVNGAMISSDLANSIATTGDPGYYS